MKAFKKVPYPEQRILAWDPHQLAAKPVSKLSATLHSIPIAMIAETFMRHAREDRRVERLRQPPFCTPRRRASPPRRSAKGLGQNDGAETVPHVKVALGPA
jgi:hypothetical protein